MNKKCFSILILSLMLAVLTACGAQAKQPDEPQADQIEPAQPVQLSEPEKTEISTEELEALFETVYTTASENPRTDWTLDFQISDEIGKINKAIPDDKKAPSDLRAIYIEWRTERTTPEPEPEPIAEEIPEPEPEPEPIAEEAPEEKPVAQQQTTSQKPSGGGGGTTTSQNNGGSQTSSNTTVERTAENNYGYNVPAGFHVELDASGGPILVNDATGRSRPLAGNSMEGYVAGTGQLEAAYEGNTGIKLGDD